MDEGSRLALQPGPASARASVRQDHQRARIRDRFQFMAWRFRWMMIDRTLRPPAAATDRDVAQVLRELNTTEGPELDEVIERLVWLVMEGRVHEDRPLLSKMSARRQQLLEDTLSHGVRESLADVGPLQDRLDCETWFTLRSTAGAAQSGRPLAGLRSFRHTTKWTTTAEVHARKVQAYERKQQRDMEVIQCKQALKTLRDADVPDMSSIKRVETEIKRLKTEAKLMVYHTRKYRLLPSPEQQQRLHRYMGTCRWTYNQGVAHFRATGKANAITLCNNYVTKTTTLQREYPEGMGPPPTWAHETPSEIRSYTLRKLASNVVSAFSNLKKNNISHFKIRFKSKKRNPLTTFAVRAKSTKIEVCKEHARPMLSIPGLKNLPICCKGAIEVASAMEIMFCNGFWYASVPQFVQPDDPDVHGRVVALDPGIRTFLTGVDLDGNCVEFGSHHVDPRTRSEEPARAHLQRLQKRASEAQSSMAVIQNCRGHRDGKQWRMYVRSKRAFNTATAKMKNCVKNLHYKASAFLVINYDTILLPEFRTQDMTRPSTSRTHGFNETILSLKHYAFRQLLKAKCARLGKTLVVCSEMYTSQTCGNCARLHSRLGASEVFHCPHCGHTAGRDINAAFNILRFVIGGSLATFQVFH